MAGLQWGQETNSHARELTSSREKNLARSYERLSRRQATAKEIRNDLSQSFMELYRPEQLRLKIFGPICIYSAAHSLLLLRGCADHRICKTLRFLYVLIHQQRPVDYLYHIAELCSNFENLPTESPSTQYYPITS